MTAVDWLPADALCDPRFALKFGEAAEEWSGRWLPSGTKPYLLKEFDVRQHRPRPSAASSAWESIGHGMAWLGSDTTAHGLAKMLVDAPEKSSALSVADKGLLSLLAREALRDLSSEIANRLALKTVEKHIEPDFRSVAMADLKLASTCKSLPELRIGISISSLAAARKAMIGSASNLGSPIGLRSDAILGEQIEAMVQLGRATLPASDLLSLSEGDIIIVDTVIDGVIPILSAKSRTKICEATLTQNNGQLLLNAVQ